MNNDKIKFILAKTYKYCSRGEKSIYDIKKYLYKENLSNEEINFIIDNLKSNNYINEKRFVEAFINDKIKLNKWGKNKILFELKSKNIDEKIIQNSFNEIDIELYKENLKYIIQKKLKTINSKNIEEKKIKITAFAISKGYNHSDINEFFKENKINF